MSLFPSRYFECFQVIFKRVSFFNLVPFNDCRYDFSMRPAKNEETNRRLNKHVWPECEFTAAQWLKDKPNTPFQALPLLEGVPGVKGPICQSRAITRHCARIAGIDGETGKG